MEEVEAELETGNPPVAVRSVNRPAGDELWITGIGVVFPNDFKRGDLKVYRQTPSGYELAATRLDQLQRPTYTSYGDFDKDGVEDVVMSEFGRTPRINKYYGRDHWGNAWSICLGGAKVQPGAVIGKTNKNGTKVIDREVHYGHLFPTYLEAVGLDSTESFNLGGRQVPMADPAHEGIHELIV